MTRTVVFSSYIADGRLVVRLGIGLFQTKSLTIVVELREISENKMYYIKWDKYYFLLVFIK